MAERKPGGLLSRVYATLVTRLRWLVLIGVGVAVYAAMATLPTLTSAGDRIGGLIGKDSPALQAQEHAVDRFGLPLLSRVAVVQHDPAGLGFDAVAAAVRQAADVDLDTVAGGVSSTGLAGALPVPNSLDPARAPTTIVTYVFGNPSQNAGERVRAAQDYAAALGPDSGVGVAGAIPVQLEQGELVSRWLTWVEIGALGAVALIVGIAFRSVAAPLVTIVSAGVAYLVAIRVIGKAAALLGIIAPAQLQPVVVALVLGVTTDYAIFFLSGLRQQQAAGRASPGRALRTAVARYLPTVLVAGITVAAGVATLVVADLRLFRAFGPGLAIAVLVGLAVSITLVPAMLAILGRWALWPGIRHGHVPAAPDDPPARSDRRHRLARLLVRRRFAGAVVLASLALLFAAASPLLGLRASVASAETLPVGNPVREAAEAAAAGFAPGVLSPTEIIVERPGVTADRAALAALQREIEAQPDVAAVVGPALPPVAGDVLPVGLLLAPGGDAARYFVVFSHDALGAGGIDDLEHLQREMPALLERAGLASASIEYAGDTALASSLVATARADLIRVGLAVALVNLVLLAVFLRALVAPLYLLVCSFLSVGAALGLTTWVFQGLLGYEGLIFYAPFAAAVLLVSLGSDYNIFSVGRIWAQARSRPLREALVAALPRSTRPINAAGLTLAASFAFVGLIPVAPFRELAFAMAVGVLIDTFLVRSLLVPGLIVLVGRVSGWPGRRLTAR